MESESDEGFTRQPGEALDIGDEFDSEDNLADGDDNMPAHTEQQQNKPQASQAAKAPAPQVKGQEVQNQHHDLAVDVNDSEEIDSEEEEDDVPMDNQQKL